MYVLLKTQQMAEDISHVPAFLISKKNTVPQSKTFYTLFKKKNPNDEYQTMINWIQWP